MHSKIFFRRRVGSDLVGQIILIVMGAKMSSTSSSVNDPPRNAEVLSLADYERRFISAAFLAQVASGLAVFVLVYVLVLLVTGNGPVALGLVGGLAFFVLWSCAIAYMWRSVIFVFAALFFLLFAVGAVGISYSYLQQTQLWVTDDTIGHVAGALGLAILPILFAWTVLLDGYRLAATRSEMRDLYVSIDRRRRTIPQILAAAVGINPICHWLAPKRRLLSSGLFVLAAIVGGFSIVLELLVLLETGPFFAIAVGSIAGGVLAAVIAIFRYFARRSARVSAENLTQSDQRAPVLFLRSFKDDQVELDKPNRGFIRSFLGMGAPAPSLDHVLLEEFTAIGPVIAIGVPGESTPFGAARTYVDDGEWRAVVAKLASDAAAIVIVVDDTEGVNWELSHIFENGHLSKTLCLMPPRDVRRSEKAAGIVRRVLVGQKCELAQPLSEPCIGWYQFAPDKILLLLAPKPSQANYVCALRLFREKQIHGYTPEVDKPRPVDSPSIGAVREDADYEIIQHVGRNVEAIFETRNGMVVRLKDGHALAPVDGKYRLFDSLEEYRRFSTDTDAWREIDSPAEKRDFLLSHSTIIQQANGQ